jgi:DNA adenine methylase
MNSRSVAGAKLDRSSRTLRLESAVSIDPLALRPPLKWAGGKRWLVPHLLPIWQSQSCERLVEPFCGGLAVAIGLMPKQALLNDINPHLVNFYRWLRRGLSAQPVKMRNAEAVFYGNRRRFNDLLSQDEAQSPEAAALFYYLNRTGYNGLCRFNRKGTFNVPFGKYRTINYLTDFSPYKSAFRHWHFAVTDFEKIELREGDFVYADPPYDVQFTQYSQGGFSWDDQVRTAKWLAKHEGPVVLSNQATDRVVKLYKSLGYDVHFLNGRRMISCTGDRTPAVEVLATRNLSLSPEP